MEKDTYTKEVNAVFLTTFVIGFPYMMFLFKPSLPEDLCISRDSLDILTCAGGRSILPFDILYFVSFFLYFVNEDVHTFVEECAFCTLGGLCGYKISSSRKLGDVDKLSPAIVQLKS